VVIKPSAGKQIVALVGDLFSPDQVTRDAAVARLTVIGGRALDRVSGVADNRAAPASARAAAFRVLESIPNPRVLDVALRSIADADDDVSIAAIDVARGFVRSPHGIAAVDRLTAAAMDPHLRVPVRLAAIRALRDLDPATVRPLLTAIKADTVPEISAASHQGNTDRGAARAVRQCLKDAAAGSLPEEGAVLGRAIAQRGGELSVAALRAIIDRVREREGAESPSRRDPWTTARGAAHLSLANRGSRAALYDLRETLEDARAPLPVEFLSAVTEAGDESCLEPIAAAYARAGDGRKTDWWRRHLAEAFRAIASRERLTRRHSVVRKIRKRWPEIFAELWRGDAH
jgi:hypothetical protein